MKKEEKDIKDQVKDTLEQLPNDEDVPLVSSLFQGNPSEIEQIVAD